MVFINDNQENVDSRYKQFIQSNYRQMKDILPQDTRIFDVMKCLGKAWKEHNDQDGVPVDEIIQNIGERWVRGESPQNHWGDIQDD